MTDHSTFNFIFSNKDLKAGIELCRRVPRSPPMREQMDRRIDECTSLIQRAVIGVSDFAVCHVQNMSNDAFERILYLLAELRVPAILEDVGTYYDNITGAHGDIGTVVIWGDSLNLQPREGASIHTLSEGYAPYAHARPGQLEGAMAIARDTILCGSTSRGLSIDALLAWNHAQHAAWWVQRHLRKHVTNDQQGYLIKDFQQDLDVAVPPVMVQQGYPYEGWYAEGKFREGFVLSVLRDLSVPKSDTAVDAAHSVREMYRLLYFMDTRGVSNPVADAYVQSHATKLNIESAMYYQALRMAYTHYKSIGWELPLPEQEWLTPAEELRRLEQGAQNTPPPSA